MHSQGNLYMRLTKSAAEHGDVSAFIYEGRWDCSEMSSPGGKKKKTPTHLV